MENLKPIPYRIGRARARLIRNDRRHFHVKSIFSILTVAFMFNHKVPSFVIHFDNNHGKVAAVEDYERGFKQMNT